MRIGLLGEHLSHSFSPKIHNYIFKEMNLSLNYELFEISKSEIKDFKNFMLSNNIYSVNITIPYKKSFFDELDFITPNAQKIGAINLMYQKNGKFYGDNTDYYGFKYTLEKNNINVDSETFYILGKGGAAACVRAVLEDFGAKSIKSLFRKNKESFIEFENISSESILINTTPVGMYPSIHDNIVPENIIYNFKVVIDLIYNPNETTLLKLARKNNVTAINGLDMLIEQAIKTDEIIFEKNLSTNLRENLRKHLLEKYFEVKK